MKFELRQQFRIESARFLPGLPEAHPCRQMHGHGFQITLRLVGEKQEKPGWVRDYHEIETKVKPLLSMIDHKVLNDVPGLENPSSENLSYWLFEKIKKEIPELIQVIVSETPSTECRYPVI